MGAELAVVHDPDAGEVWVWHAAGHRFKRGYGSSAYYDVTCSASAFCALFDTDGGPTLTCRADSPTELQREAYAKHRELAGRARP